MHSLAYIFLQLMLTAVAYAAPIEASGGSLDTYAPGVGGVLGFIVLVLDILVFIEVLKSNRPPLHKLAWCLVVFFFPIGGMIIYWLFSNRAEHNSGGGYEPLP
ncbi:hypothetical protein B0T11DRAFT_282413 [Plectosphaerella cucumerina]|uniref:Cardiolipin synthase N-terminal domain-containing protein n=1 Tax=Plectosphaerella cucumerina TaxID=40658 RepID=A0A8K0TG21_9PEZI|nr:hypothetical protein B0T11DRAFT_282413 [Plectosphaerella cucumerina]